MVGYTMPYISVTISSVVFAIDHEINYRYQQDPSTGEKFIREDSSRSFFFYRIIYFPLLNAVFNIAFFSPETTSPGMGVRGGRGASLFFQHHVCFEFGIAAATTRKFKEWIEPPDLLDPIKKIRRRAGSPR